jgi:hypothetical protein
VTLARREAWLNNINYPLLMPCIPVGAVEQREAAIFAQTLESKAKDQKIAAFGSSYGALDR